MQINSCKSLYSNRLGGTVPKLNVLVTAGATREPIDPVRFISNYATGFLGCEIARQAQKRGHRVILITGAIGLEPANIKSQGLPLRSINVETASQMQEVLQANFSWCDCLIMTAAVGDFGVKETAAKKLKRTRAKAPTLKLKRNPDILKGLSRHKDGKMLVGFALETEDLKKNAQAKLREKDLDLIVATQMPAVGGSALGGKNSRRPFGNNNIDVLILEREGHSERVRQITKRKLAQILLKKIETAAYPSG